MTLALYGKSRKRQGGLLLAAFLAVMVAMLGAVANITGAFAHHLEGQPYGPTCANGNTWRVNVTEGSWSSYREAVLTITDATTSVGSLRFTPYLSNGSGTGVILDSGVQAAPVHTAGKVEQYTGEFSDNDNSSTDINDSITSLIHSGAVAWDSNFVAGQVFRWDNELMKITARSGDGITLTVERGFGDTNPASHSSNVQSRWVRGGLEGSPNTITWDLDGEIVACPQPKLKVVKNVIDHTGADVEDPEDFSFTVSNQTGFDLDDDASSASPLKEKSFVLPAVTGASDVYTITETDAGANGFSLDSITCVGQVGAQGNPSGAGNVSVTVNNTSDVTCTFVNKKAPPVMRKLLVCKNVVDNGVAPTTEGGQFGFTVTGGASTSFNLTSDENDNDGVLLGQIPCGEIINVVEGVATTVSESSLPAGWAHAAGWPKIDNGPAASDPAPGSTSTVVTVTDNSCDNGVTTDGLVGLFHLAGADCVVIFENKMGPVVQQFGTSTVGKTHSGDGTPNLGENFTYTITFTVAGGPLNGQKFFSDILPASLEFQGTPFGTQTDPGNFLTCTNTTTAVNCNLADLTPIGVYSQVVNVHVKTGATCGPVINNVKIGADTAQGDTVATDTVNVEGCGELGIEKSDSTQTVDAGANIVWTIGLRNSSVVPATAYVLDAGATLVAPAACTQAGGAGTVITCNVPASNGNSTPELLVTVKTAKPVQTGTQMCTPQDVTNTAYLVDSTTEITPSGADDPSDSGKFTIPATANANCIKVKKLAAGPGDWNITFTNSGPAADINFSDTYQDGGSNTDIVSIKNSANSDVAGCTPGQPFPDGTKQVSGCNLNLPNGVTVITVHTEVPANSCNGWKVGNTVAAFMGTGSPTQGAPIPGDTTEADKTASASYSGTPSADCFVISKTSASPDQDATHVFWDISIKNNTAESQHVFVKDSGAAFVSASGGSCNAVAGDAITNGVDCQVAAGATLIVKVSKAKNLQVCSDSASNSAVINLGSHDDGTPVIGEPSGGTINYTNQSECTEIIEVCKFWRLSDGEVGGLPARDFDFQIQDSDTSENFSLNVAEGQIGDCVNIEVARGDVTVSELPPGSGFVTTHKLNDADTEVAGASITFNTFECQPLEQIVDPLVQSIFSLVIDPPTDEEPICTVYFFNEDPGVSLPTGNLLIQKFLDINGDGDANDPGEHEIFNWGVTTDGPGLNNDHQVTVDEVTYNGILYVGLEHGDVYSVTEDLPAGWQITRATVNGANMGDSTNVNATITDGGTTIVQFFNRQLGGISVHKTTVNVKNGIETVNTNDDDGWTITVKSALCGIDLSLDTDANGNAVFSGLPMCTDYVIAEVLASGEPGYSPVTPASVSGKTPTVGGNTQVNFTNETRSFDPPCPNCTPGTQTVPTPTPTPPTPVPPTPCVGCTPGGVAVTPTVPPASPTTGTTPPVTAVAGEKTPGQTPIAPSTGEGGSGGNSGGLNLLLVLGGLGALAGGITFMAMGRKNRG